MLKEIVYRYDGSFEGFLCCIFQSYLRKEIPFLIVPEEHPQHTLFPEIWIPSDSVKAQRVFTSLKNKVSSEIVEMVQLGFLSCMKEKELVLLRFIRLCFSLGSSVLQYLVDDTVHTLNKAILHLRNEEQKIKGFLHFYECNGILIAEIEPKNFQLPVIAEHFCSRYPEETFCIYDLTHQYALIYQPYQVELIPVQHLSLPPLEKQELQIESLWKHFVKTIAVEGRINPRCQMNLMPKRYWNCMIEHRDHLHSKDSNHMYKIKPV